MRLRDSINLLQVCTIYIILHVLHEQKVEITSVYTIYYDENNYNDKTCLYKQVLYSNKNLNNFTCRKLYLK